VALPGRAAPAIVPVGTRIDGTSLAAPASAAAVASSNISLTIFIVRRLAQRLSGFKPCVDALPR
jgi:hypothetical protein